MSLNQKNIYIGIDAGTQSVKVAAFDNKMQCICSFSKATTIYNPSANCVQMDIDEFLAHAIDGLTKVSQYLQSHAYDVNNVKAIMADGIICGICGIDEQGHAITPYLNYLDSRTADDVDYLNSLDLSMFAKQTGNPKANCMFAAMFARYFLKNDQNFRQKGIKFVHNAPYILMHLAGLKAQDAFVDQGTMSGWGMGYHVIEKKWSKEQLDFLGIDIKYMPKILKPWDCVGNLCEDIAHKTNLPTSVKILAGAGDTMQSMLGCGVFKAGQCVDVAGTCAMFCVATDGIIEELSNSKYNLIFNSGSLDNTYFYWGFVRTGGLALRYFKDKICQKQTDNNYYQHLSQQASKIKAGSNGVLFLPYLSNGLDNLKHASGCFLNLSLDDDIYVMWRAVLESIGFDYMQISKIYKQAKIKLDTITVTEGGSQDELWNQIKADMLKTKVKTYKLFGGALATNCIFAAYAVGDISDLQQSLEQILILNKEYICDDHHNQIYEHIYQIKEKLVNNQLQNSFDTLFELKHFCPK